MAPPSPSKLQAERSSVKVSVSTLALDLPPPTAAAGQRPRPAASQRARHTAHARSPARPGCAHADCQTDPSLLEPLEAPEAEAAAQTDATLPPPRLPAPPPLPPAGTDVSTQVSEDDLFDFERDAVPAVRAMAAAALQSAVAEAEGEARLEALRRRRRELEEVRCCSLMPVCFPCGCSRLVQPTHGVVTARQAAERPAPAPGPCTVLSRTPLMLCPSAPLPLPVLQAADREQQEVQMLEEAALRRAAERERLQQEAERLTAAAPAPAAQLGGGTGVESTAQQPAAPVLLDMTAEQAVAAGCGGEASVGAEGDAAAGSGPAAAEEPATTPGSSFVEESMAEPAAVGLEGSTCASGDGETAAANSTAASPVQEPAAGAPAEDGAGQEGEAAAPASASEAKMASAPAGGSWVLDGAGEGEAASAPALDTAALEQEARPVLDNARQGEAASAPTLDTSTAGLDQAAQGEPLTHESGGATAGEA